jgi:2-dehydro-3-deoxy-L-fuconate 4-dehydrogenase
MPTETIGRRVAGKRILVTAAGQGMGRAAALALARGGGTVVATDVNSGLVDGLSAESVATGGAEIETRRLDVTDGAAIEALIAQLPPLDALFNCAGYVHQGTIFETSEQDWDASFELNVRSMFRTIKAALPKMIDHGGGSIINMASVCSSVKGLPNRFAYGTTKAAVIGLTKSIAADFVAKGIRCNCIAPGTVDTPSLQERMRALGDPIEARKMFVSRQPMGRLATPEEIVPIVVYLASDESVCATGQIFTIDGGITI